MSFMKARKYHVIRIIYSDGKIHHRSFANKHIALRWLAYRKRVSFVLAKLGFGPFCPMSHTCAPRPYKRDVGALVGALTVRHERRETFLVSLVRLTSFV